MDYRLHTLLGVGIGSFSVASGGGKIFGIILSSHHQIQQNRNSYFPWASVSFSIIILLKLLFRKIYFST